ncbi:RICIN domain-containing protein [Streptomyces sp. NPDC085479]|uniref:RICIN domain-containing protein n=1 Tax=Streptomyces sp. NPDC085479 TaxID=3365726 RepID=UPI0037D64EEC
MKITSGRGKRLIGLMLGAAVAASVLLPVQPAQAAPGLAPFAANFKLTRIDGDKSGLISSAEAAGIARAGSVSEVLGERTGVPELCHGTGLNGAYRYDGFCWDSADDFTGYNDANGGWMPRGFAGAHAATADGFYEGRSLYAASWYYGKYADRKANEEYTRVTIAESTGDRVSYGHIALVEPVNGNFKNLTYLSHADGVAWHENRLFVANGVELQVYDLKRMWRMSDTGSTATGLVGGKSSARQHRWALPLVARYSTYGGAEVDTPSTAFRPGGNARSCGPENANVLCLSTLSIDRSGASPVLVSTENRSGAGARIVRWPLTALGAGTPTLVSSEATGYTSPVWGIQGTATDGTDYYMSGSCPAGWPGWDAKAVDEDGKPIPHNKLYACIHKARPGEAPHVISQAPWLTQGLSWDRRVNRLWGLNEALDSGGVGRRVVFSIDTKAGKADPGGSMWLANHNRPGFVCATPQSNGTANGTPITVWPCSGSESQRWKYDNGLIVHKASGKCITPQGNASGTDGTLLTLWTCNPASDVQKFFTHANGTANAWGKAITPKGNSLDSGVWLTLWTQGSPTPDVQEWVVKAL